MKEMHLIFLPFFLLEVRQIQNHQRRLSQEHPMALGERPRPPPEPVQPAAPVSSGPVSTVCQFLNLFSLLVLRCGKTLCSGNPILGDPGADSWG